MSTVSLLLLLSINHIYSQYVSCSGDCTCPAAPNDTTCTLDCDVINGCQGHTLTCRAGDPCIVICGAKSACSNATIIADSATDVTVVCDRHSACRYDIDITCGTGDCLLQCQKPTSCLDWGNIDVSQAKSYDCIGNNCPFVPVPFSAAPTTAPTTSATPTQNPTNIPSFSPSNNPLTAPTISPTITPTNLPQNPTISPSFSSQNPSTTPTNFPSFFPTNYPTAAPTTNPTFFTTNSVITTANIPSFSPTKTPSFSPTDNPPLSPTNNPTITTTYTSMASSSDIASLGIGKTKTLSNNAVFLSIAAMVCCILLLIIFMFFLFERRKRKEKRQIIENKLRNANAKLNAITNNKMKDKQISDNVSPSSLSPAASAIMDASSQQSINQTHAICQQQLSPRYYSNSMYPQPHSPSPRPLSPKRQIFLFPQCSASTTQSTIDTAVMEPELETGSQAMEVMQSIDEDMIMELETTQPMLEFGGQYPSINSEVDTVIVYIEPNGNCNINASEIVDEGILKHVE